MLRRIFALMMTLLMLPVLSIADEYVPYEMLTFSSSLPERLREPLSALIPDETQVISGAAIQHNGSHFGDAPSFLDSYTAMVLVDTADGPRLYAAAWVENLPWQVNDYTRFLRQSKNVYVSLYKPDVNNVPVFSVDYSVQGGVKSDLFDFFCNKLWCMRGHIDKGAGVKVMNHFGEVERTEGVAFKDYLCGNPFFLDYMEDISAYPITREAAEALAIACETAHASDAAVNRVYASGAHLRREPTGKSESLGVYAHNTPMTFTGEQKPGTLFPWYQVIVGGVTGWMSSNYVDSVPDVGIGTIPVGRTVTGCALYATAKDKTPTMELAPGTTFHVLAEYEGMYHICIPRGEITFAVDAEGTYGYIPTKDVLTGYSPSSLDAQESAR